MLGTSSSDHLPRFMGMAEPYKDIVCGSPSPAESQQRSARTMTFFKSDGGEDVFLSLHAKVD